MTASPTAAVSSPPKAAPASGGNALAALFAAAAASSMQRQMASSPKTTRATATIATPTSATKYQPQTPKSAPKTVAPDSDKDANNSAAKLIASLLNSASKSSPSTSASPSAATGATKVATTLAAIMAEASGARKLVAPVTPNGVTNNLKEIISSASSSTTTTTTTANASSKNEAPITPDHVVLRNLESWKDESVEPMDDSCYHELVESGNPNGWTPDEMFKYNEKRHKVLSSYSERTLSDSYTTPLSKNKSKTTIRMATQLAKEIEQKVLAEGRITPESSDDDEIYEQERIKQVQLKQLKQLEQLKNLKVNNGGITIKQTPTRPRAANGSNFSPSYNNINNRSPTNHQHSCIASARKSNRSSSHYSNSSTTPATASLSSSPTLNDSNTIMKPVTSSSRNILRTCLT